MNLFIKNILFFFLILAASLTIPQMLISHRIKGRVVRSDDDLDITANVNADMVFLGSSRCRCHFDPRHFDSVFHIRSVNIGVGGHSELSMAITRLKTYLLTNKPPKIAILSFDALARPGSFIDNKNFIRKNDFARYAFMPDANNRLMLDYYKFNTVEKYVPLYAILRYQLLPAVINMDLGKNIEQYGYEVHDEKWDTVATPVHGKLPDKYFAMADTARIATALDSLNRFCRQHDIRLICVQTPVYKVWHNEDLSAAVGNICKAANVPFVDGDAEFIRNDMDCFYNPLHLNKNGVGRFGQYLSADPGFRSLLKFR